MSKTTELLKQAERLAQNATTWADLSNALYDPLEGLLAAAFPTREERRQFLQTPEYKQIQQLLADAMNRFGLTEGATPKRITEYMVQLHLATANDADATARFKVEGN
jgi:hypothetical protein